MPRRKKQGGSHHHQASTRTEDRGDSRAAPVRTREVIDVGGEKFTLSHESSNTGLRHIRDRHVSRNETADEADTASKFPEHISDDELKDLIRKTVANGRWYPHEDADNSRKRVYLWDSRADEQARSMGLHQICVVTTNCSLRQHDIITAYPQHGTNIGIAGGSRGNTAALDTGRQIEETLDDVARRTTEIRDAVQQITDFTFDRNTDLSGDPSAPTLKPSADKEFLDNNAKSHAELSGSLNITRRSFDTAKNQHRNANLWRGNQDPNLHELIQHEIDITSKVIQDVDEKLKNLENANNLAHNHLQTGAGNDDRQSNRVSELSRLQHLSVSDSQQVNKKDSNEIRKNIKEINKNIDQINKILNIFISKESQKNNQLHESMAEYSAGTSDMTAAKFRYILIKLRDESEALVGEHNSVLDTTTPLFERTNQLANNTFAESQYIKDVDVKNQIPAIQKKLGDTKRKIDEKTYPMFNFISSSGMILDIVNKTIERESKVFEHKYSKPADESTIKGVMIQTIVNNLKCLNDKNSDIRREEADVGKIASDLRKKPDQELRRITTTTRGESEMALSAMPKSEMLAEIRKTLVREDMKEVVRWSRLLKDSEFARKQRDHTTNIINMSNQINDDIIKNSRDIRQRLIRAMPELAQQARQNG